MHTKNRYNLFTYLFTVTALLTGVNSSQAQIEALGQCTGVTTSDTYKIKVRNLPLGVYTIQFDAVDQTLLAVDSFVSAELAYIDGTKTVEVLVINNVTMDSTTLYVHEVLCTDVDSDGNFDFNTEVCDYSKPLGTGGAIVATVAPYTSENVYLYILTGADSLYTASTVSNYSGLFEDLPNGTYEMFAFNFLSTTDATTFLSGLSINDNIGTISAAAPACYALCGSETYSVACQSIVDIYVDPVDYMVCMEGDAQFFVQDSFLVDPPSGTTLEYQWEVNTGSGWSSTTDGTSPDSVLDLTNVTFADSGNLYRVIVTMKVAAATISMDTSGVGTLSVYDDPVFASGLDVTINNNEVTGVAFTLTGASVPADSFEVISVNVNGLTAGGSNAVIPQTTIDANYISNDTYENNTGGPDTAFYEVVAISEQGCRGDTITIYVEVRPCPEVDDLALIEVCSQTATGLVLPSVDNNTLSIDSFSITASTGPNISGTPTDGVTTDVNYLNGDVFTNTSDVVDTVTYTIIAYSNNCASAPFEAKVAIMPEPVYADIVLDQCSDIAIGVTLVYADTSGLNVDSVDISAVVGGTLTGTATTGTGITSTSAISGDVFGNTTDLVDSVVYTITPYSKGCVGASYDITVRIVPEAVFADVSAEVCSDIAIGVNLVFNDDSGLTIDSVDIAAVVGDSLSGTATTGTGITSLSAIAGDIFSNTSEVTDSVIYTVTPYSAGCLGEPFEIKVVVKPEPDGQDEALTVCSDEALDIVLTDNIINGTSLAGFTYTVASSDAPNVPPAADRTDTLLSNITDTYTNQTGGFVIITYTVTPISTDGCAGNTFDVDVTVDPEPVLSASLDTTVCSDALIGVILAVETGSVLADSFDIVSINADVGLTASAGSPAAPITVTSTSEISDDAWTNTSTGALDVTYRIAPWTGGCRGDEVDVVVTIDPTPVVNAGSDETICSTEKVDLTGLGATITGGASNGTWSSTTGGVFDEGVIFSSATTYTPSTADLDAGTVTLTLTSDNPSGECGTVLDTVVIEILDIRCSEFPWNGND